MAHSTPASSAASVTTMAKKKMQTLRSSQEVFKRFDGDPSGCKYSAKQQGVFEFASNGCAFPKLVVAVVDKLDCHPHDVVVAINKIDPKADKQSFTLDEIVDAMKIGPSFRP